MKLTGIFKLLLIGFLLLLAGSGCDDSTNEYFVPPGNEVPVGKNVIRVGTTKSDSSGASSALNGLLYWEKWLNKQGGIKVGGKTWAVKLYHENESNPPGLAAENLLIMDSVDFLIGPVGGNETKAMKSVANKYQTAMINAHSSPQDLNDPNVVNIPITQLEQITAPLNMLLSKDSTLDRICIIAIENEVNQPIATQLETWGASVNVDVFRPSIPQQEEMERAIQELKNESKKDILVHIGTASATRDVIAKCADLQYEPRAMVVTHDLSDPTLLSEARSTGLLQGVQWHREMKTTGKYISTSEKFATDFRDSGYDSADVFAARSMAAGLALYQAILDSNSLDSLVVRKALKNLNLNTFYGPLHFDASGRNDSKKGEVIQIENGQVLYRANAASLVHPKPSWSQP